MITASELNSLKTKIKNEMARRKYDGSLVDYSGSSYDFSTTPSSGNKILLEHGEKTINLMLKVQDVGNLRNVATGEKIPSSFDYDTLNSKVTAWASESLTGSSSSCRGACSGLCVGVCMLILVCIWAIPASN